MDIVEITGLATGVSDAGVNFLQPADSFTNIQDGYIYRQVLQSRLGAKFFGKKLPVLVGQAPPTDNRRVYGIFEHILPDGSTELLVCDANFLYKYDDTIGEFAKIPFGGSMGPAGSNYVGFSITSKNDYISGTSYPVAPLIDSGAANPEFNQINQGARFIFTGRGILPNSTGSFIFFYNGTDVRDFTDLTDNPNYQDPLINGAPERMYSATYVTIFGERLNFICPLIGADFFNQSMVFSGIRNSIGNGDKFAVAGSGTVTADTYEYITGILVLGQIIALNFTRSNWTIEKTRDAFNPYFIRKVPSVLGTNASFSAVSWFNIVKSMGKTGIISSDGRESVRVDNKIPNFTRDKINQVEFDIIYGGFDRLNNVFMWSYIDSESESATQDRVLVNNYEEDSWSVYKQAFSCFGQTDKGLDKAWNAIVYSEVDPTWGEWQTTTDIWGRIGIEEAIQKTLAGDDFGNIWNLSIDLEDQSASIGLPITTGVTTTLTVSNSTFVEGDRIAIQNIVGMVELNNYSSSGDNVDFEPWNVISSTTTTIEIDADSTAFTPYISGGTASKTIQFEAETIPFNPYRAQGYRVYVSHVEFLINTGGGFLKVSVFADEEDDAFKEKVLLLPSSDSNKEREWVTLIVDQEANFMTFKMEQESANKQVKLTSMRIHCMQGGLTSG